MSARPAPCQGVWGRMSAEIRALVPGCASHTWVRAWGGTTE
jgi:hypothetical protein